MMRGILLVMNLFTLVFLVTDGMVLALDTLISDFLFFSQDLLKTVVLHQSLAPGLTMSTIKTLCI